MMDTYFPSHVMMCLYSCKNDDRVKDEDRWIMMMMMMMVMMMTMMRMMTMMTTLIEFD